MGAALAITADDFDTEVLQSDIPVLVDFYGNACPPCRALAPTIDKLAAEYDGRVKIVKLDTAADENFEISVAHQLSSIPTLVYYKGGEVVDVQVGFQSQAKIEDALERVLSAS